jgi:hypothetical protein
MTILYLHPSFHYGGNTTYPRTTSPQLRTSSNVHVALEVWNIIRLSIILNCALLTYIMPEFWVSSSTAIEFTMLRTISPIGEAKL